MGRGEEERVSSQQEVYEQPEYVVRCEGVFAQSAQFPIRPQKDCTRLWLDVWVSPVDRERLLAFWQQDIPLMVTIEAEPPGE